MMASMIVARTAMRARSERRWVYVAATASIDDGPVLIAGPRVDADGAADRARENVVVADRLGVATGPPRAAGAAEALARVAVWAS